MKKYFTVNLIRNGILGRNISLNDDYLLFKTDRLTVPNEMRNLNIRFKTLNQH